MERMPDPSGVPLEIRVARFEKNWGYEGRPFRS